MSYDYQGDFNKAIGTKLLPPEQGVSGVPIWERGQFSYGAGPFAPGGPGGGMTIGPRGSGGPGSCPQVGGGHLVCVQPPMTARGVETGRGWPPEIGPQEEQMMEVGCVATGRRCGGSPRAPAQYWCCPSAGGMPMPFIGTPFPTTSGGLGNGESEAWVPNLAPVLVAVAAMIAGSWFLSSQLRRPMPNPRDYLLNQIGDNEFEVIINNKVVGSVEKTGLSGKWWGYYTSGNPQRFSTMEDAASFVSGAYERRYTAKTPF